MKDLSHDQKRVSSFFF